MSPLLTPHQQRLMFVAADDGSIVTTLQSPLMRRAKIKMKNKKVISGDPKVVINDPSSAANLCSRR
jgi:hypothetical protein